MDKPFMLHVLSLVLSLVALMFPSSALAQTAPKLSVSPSALSFSSTPSGTFSAPKLITLKNLGGGVLQISGVAISGINSPDFAADGTCNSALSTNQVCSVSVSFRPTAIGARVATLQIQTSVGTKTMALKGTGAAPPQPAITISPTSLAFPSTTIGVKSSGLTLKLTNTGKAALQVSSVIASNSQEFSSVQNCSASSLAPAGTCTITVSFTPSTTGSRTGSLVIKSNIADRTVSLKGVGAAPAQPAITISPTSLAFPSTTIGAKSSGVTLKLTNTGKAALQVSSVIVSNSQEFSAVQNCSASSLAPAGTCTITVSFTPSTTGSRTGSLVIKSNIADRTVSLKGVGAAPAQPAITISPMSLAFPSTVTGVMSEAKIVSVKNTGTATLKISTITVTGAHSTDFASTNNCGSQVASKESCSISVSFRPSATGMRFAALTIDNNAIPATVALNGQGEKPLDPKLTVTKSGEGVGSVSSSPSGIDCGQTCAVRFTVGVTVTLTATASTGSKFTGWSGGGCSGVGSCIVRMGADQQVTAVFALKENASPVAKTGRGKSVDLGTEVDLDGSASVDPEGSALTYLWTLTDRPVGSNAILLNPTSARSKLIPDVVGVYSVALEVSDGAKTGRTSINIEASPGSVVMRSRRSWNRIVEQSGLLVRVNDLSPECPTPAALDRTPDRRILGIGTLEQGAEVWEYDTDVGTCRKLWALPTQMTAIAVDQQGLVVTVSSPGAFQKRTVFRFDKDGNKISSAVLGVGKPGGFFDSNEEVHRVQGIDFAPDGSLYTMNFASIWKINSVTGVADYVSGESAAGYDIDIDNFGMLRAIDFSKRLYLFDVNLPSSPAVKVPLEWSDLDFSPIVR